MLRGLYFFIFGVSRSMVYYISHVSKKKKGPNQMSFGRTYIPMQAFAPASTHRVYYRGDWCELLVDVNKGFVIARTMLGEWLETEYGKISKYCTPDVRLLHARKTLKLSRPQIAQKIGMTFNRYQALERGLKAPTKKELTAIKTTLGIFY